MRTPLPTRRWVGRVPCALLATLLVVVRLLAPAAAMPSASPALAEFDRLARASICHVAPGEPAKEAPAGHADCVQCPACHLSAATTWSLPADPALPTPPATLVRLAAVPPPATGPPGRPRGGAQPTGPPVLSA